MYSMVKGGVIVRNISEFPGYNRCHGNDCLPAALYDLGLADRESATLIANSYQGGVNTAEIITILNRAYGGNHMFRMFHVSDRAIIEISEQISELLRPNEGMIGFVSITMRGGERLYHVVVIFKNDTELFIRDPQKSTSEPLVRYINRLNVDQVGVIDTPDSGRVSIGDVPRINEELISELVNEGSLPASKFRMIRDKTQRRGMVREGGRKTRCRARGKTRKHIK